MSRPAGFAIAAIGLLVFAAACSDANLAEPTKKAPLTGPIVRNDTLRGMIRLNGDDAVSQSDIVFITADGNEVKLVGPVADLLANVHDMELWVAGEFTAAGEMMVQRFAFRDPDAACVQPVVAIFPDIGPPCDDPTLMRPITANNPALSRKP